jgi:hypothetical protein
MATLTIIFPYSQKNRSCILFTFKWSVMISEWSAHALIADVVIAVAESFRNTALRFHLQL